jgi:hypothetical protein
MCLPTQAQLMQSIDNQRPGSAQSGSGGGGGSLLQTLKGKVCKVITNGRVTSLGGGIGGLRAEVGSVDMVVNYDTGDSSLFGTGGMQFGWNGGASATFSTGAIWGSLGPGNVNYAGPFVGLNGSVGLLPPLPPVSVGGSAVTSSSVTVVQASVGAALLGRYAFGLTRTVTSKPLPLARFSGFRLEDLHAYLLRRLICR